jgi:hypothetical protein
MNPTTYQAWMNPAAYAMFMNPNTYMQWMNPGAFAMPASAGGSNMFDPNFWAQQSQGFAQGQGGVNPFDPSTWAATPQTEDQAAAEGQIEGQVEGEEKTQ